MEVGLSSRSMIIGLVMSTVTSYGLSATNKLDRQFNLTVDYLDTFSRTNWKLFLRH